jgi:putative transposase
MAYLIEQVGALCARKDLPLPDRPTIEARVDCIDRRTVALKRKDANDVKAPKAMSEEYASSGPLDVVQIDHTEVDVFLVNETTRKTTDKRPSPMLAIDVFTCLVVGFHLSIAQPFRISLGLCMLNAVYDKSAWSKCQSARKTVCWRLDASALVGTYRESALEKPRDLAERRLRA